MLAKHKKALSTEKWSGYVLTLCVYVLAMMVMNGWAERHGAEVATFFEVTTCVLFLVLMYMGLVTAMHKYQVDTLKEVKQVQLQLLELQASIRKDREQ